MEKTLEYMAKERLENKIKISEANLKRAPKNAHSHFAKAQALQELGKVTGEKLKYYKEAMPCYEKAIEFGHGDENLSLYQVGKLDLSIIMMKEGFLTNQKSLANDIVETIKAGSTGNKVIDSFVKNTLQNILKLPEVREEVDRLQKESGLPSEIGSKIILVTSEFDKLNSPINTNLLLFRTNSSKDICNMVYVYPNLKQARTIARKKGLPIPYSSYKPTKKLYVVYNNKEIHFGARGMSDYLFHKDEERRDRYRKRHEAIKLKDGSYAFKNLNQPAFYAYHILW